MLIPFKDLFAKYFIQPKGIIHCGSSTGQEAQEYYNLGIETVIWIEAVPEVYNDLVKNVSQLHNKNICVNACIGERDGEEVIFNVSNNEAQSSSFLKLGTHKTAHPSVGYIRSFTATTKTVKTILNELGIVIDKGWLFVADLQGVELLAIKGAGDLMKQFDFCYLEINTAHLYEGCALKHEVEEYLSKYNFVPVEEFIYQQWGWGDEFFIKKSLLIK